MRHPNLATLLPSLLCLVACASAEGEKTDAQYEHDIVTGMHATLLADLRELHGAAEDIERAAPAPSDRGWDGTLDAEAVQGMTEAWLRARSAYERTEGAIAPLFPEIDAEIDERYEGFLEELGGEGDPDLFDDQGVTGMHAVERILFAKTAPASVVTMESTLPGYRAAAWPATPNEAAEFKTKLCARLASDTGTLLEQWQPQRVDIALAYDGLVALMREQREKVNKAASDEEESRYAERTLADVRDNLEGTRRVYGLFQPWLLTKTSGPAIDRAVEHAFDALAAAYGAVPGDAFPAPPATWSSEDPSAADLETPFGRLFNAVHQAVDPTIPGSAVESMNRAAEALGLPGFGAP